MSNSITLSALESALTGSAAAFRSITKLQPVGGEGDKVFPSTYAGGVYATEKRRLPGESDYVECVLLNSVQSEANHAELALRQAISRGEIHLPLIEADFTGCNHKFRKPVPNLTSLEVPHRLADAILRDCALPDGVRFSQSDYARNWSRANLWNATPIYEICPTALVFGMWGSPDKPGGLGAKFERAYVSEVVAVDTIQGCKRMGFRIDPLETSSNVRVIKTEQGFQIVPNASGKERKTTASKDEVGVAPSKVNHGNIIYPKEGTKSIDGIRCRYAEQTTVVSLGALRKLQFPISGKQSAGQDNAARTVLAAIGLCAGVLAADRGTSLRSRCHLIPVETRVWRLVDIPGRPQTEFEVTGAQAVALLNEAVAAAADLSSGRPEWPPHPGRVFMALAAAHFETGEDPAERRALEWLESAPPPSVSASGDSPRSYHETYVPVNDQGTRDALLARSRQPRTFPKTRPDDESVYLTWPVEAPPDLRLVLDRLCIKVTRIGHSSSLAQVWLLPLTHLPPGGPWRPDDSLAGVRMRVPRPGTIQALERDFNKVAILEHGQLVEAHEAAKGAAKRKLKAEIETRFPQGQPRPTRPRVNSWLGYSREDSMPVAQPAHLGPFERDFIVLGKTEGCALGLESTLQLTSALRNAAMKAAGIDPPEWLTGHEPGGAPSRHPHAAFFPLPFVGHKHADGHVLGLGIAIPSAVAQSTGGALDLRHRIGPLLFNTEGEPRSVHLWRDQIWDWRLEREIRDSPPTTLRRSTWTGPSKLWASVTPVVLHHHPKKREGDVERIAREAFASALLPEPVQLLVRPASVLEGAGHIRSMPTYDEGPTGLSRYQVHLLVEFASPVRGPILVGRGRFRGYGLFAPCRGSEPRS